MCATRLGKTRTSHGLVCGPGRQGPDPVGKARSARPGPGLVVCATHTTPPLPHTPPSPRLVYRFVRRGVGSVLVCAAGLCCHAEGARCLVLGGGQPGCLVRGGAYPTYRGRRAAWPLREAKRRDWQALVDKRRRAPRGQHEGTRGPRVEEHWSLLVLGTSHESALRPAEARSLPCALSC